MASVARRLVSFDDPRDRSPGAVRRVDYLAVPLPTKLTREERAKGLTASQKIRRRHRAWLTLIDKGIQTPQEIASDNGVTVQAVYYGINQARKRERKIKDRV